MTQQTSLGPELACAADILVRDYMAVRPNESVLITADTASDMAAVQAVANSVRLNSAVVATLIMPRLPFQGALADPYIPEPLSGAVMACDVWIDLTFPYLAGAHVHDEAVKRGRVRYLLGGDMGADSMVRLFGEVDLDAYYEVHKQVDTIIQGAVGKEVRITDRLGTDVRFNLAKPGFTKPRRADKPGMYLVPGSCTMFPEIESVRGTICVGSVFHEYYTALKEPISLEVDGKIRRVIGGGADHRVLDRALRRAGGGEYGYVIHFTHAIHPAARETGKSFIEDSRVVGSNAVGFGLPWWVPGGGENHPDAVITMHSVWVDGHQLVEDGSLVGPPKLAKGARALLPEHAAAGPA